MAKKQTKKEKKSARQSVVASQQEITRTPFSSLWTSMTNWLILLVLILPVLFSRATIDPVIAPRYIFLSGFVLIFVLFFYVLRKKAVAISYAPIIKWMFGLGLAFGLWSLFTLSFAINIAEGYYQVARHFLNLILLFVVMVTIGNEESQAGKLGKAFVILSIIQSIAGIGQYYDLGFTDIPGANANPYGLMANRNLFGSAQMLMLPFVLFSLYKAGKIWKYASVFALILLIVSLVISQTRSAWLGSLAVLFVSLILVSIFSPSNRKRWLIGSLSGLVAVALIVWLLFATDEEGDLSKSVKERAGITSGAAEKDSQPGANANERLKIWARSVDMIKDHPFTGVGPGNWRIAIPPYGGNNIAWATGNFIPDRPHNVYLHVLSETGIPGAILYFGMWVILAIIAFKVVVKTRSGDQRILVILMFAGLAGFACDSFFSFPTERIEHSLYMILMAGVILGCYSSLPAVEPKKSQRINKKLVLLFTAIAAFNLFLGLKKQSFETHMNLAKAYEKMDRNQEMLNEVKAGKSTWVTIDPDNKPLEMYSGFAYQGLKDYTRALEQMNIAKRYNPNSAMLYNNIATVYTDMKQYDSAISNLQHALRIAPKFELVYKNLAMNYFLSEDYARCIETIGKMNIEGDQFFTGMLNDAKRLLEAKK
jgi:O-antigen ligase